MLTAIGVYDPTVIAMAVAAMSGLSFYAVFGAGQFNVSQPGFMAIGAYAVGMCSSHGQSLLLGVAIGIAGSIPLSLLLVLVTQRLSGVYLAIATLAFVEVVQQVITLTPALKGPLGIYGIPLTLTPQRAWLIVIAVAAGFFALMRSRIGLEMMLLREDVIVARGAGVNDLRIKLFCAGLSAALAAVAGAMTALSTSYISPDEFSFALLISTMSAVIIGGSERYWGAIIGGIVLTELPELTRVESAYRPLMTGGVLLAVILLAPEGIAGAGIRLRAMLSRRRTTRLSPQSVLASDGGSP